MYTAKSVNRKKASVLKNVRLYTQDESFDFRVTT